MILPENSAWRKFQWWYKVLVTKIRPQKKKKATWRSTISTKTSRAAWNQAGPGYCTFLGKDWGTIAFPTAEVHFFSPKAAQTLTWRFGVASFQVKRSCQASKKLTPRAQTSSPRGKKTDPRPALVRHIVDVQRAFPDFRGASEKRHDTSCQTNRFNKKYLQSFARAEAGDYQLMGSRAPTRKRCLRESDRTQLARHHTTRSIWECRSWHSYQSVPHDPSRMMRDSFQQWHLQLQY